MAVVLQPWQILVSALAGWTTNQQDSVIEYLQEENRVLKQQLGAKRLRLTDAQRRRLAVRGKAIGRRALTEVVRLPPRSPNASSYRSKVSASTG
jgi:putative transposase